jgi:chemotaxis protein CheD
MTAPLRMNLAKLEKVFVLGGRIVIATVPQQLVTILGSCVSVCLWDRKTRVGGMNHYLLPEIVNEARSLDGGIGSTRMMIRSMTQKFSVIKNVEAKIYGGSNRFFTDKSFLNVGNQNIMAAKFVLEEAGIPIVQEDTGGKAGRKIYFNTYTGMVRVEKINYEGTEETVIKKLGKLI